MSRRHDKARPTMINRTVELLNVYSWKNMPKIAKVMRTTKKWYFVSIMNSWMRNVSTESQKTAANAWLSVRVDIDWVGAIRLCKLLSSFCAMYIWGIGL